MTSLLASPATDATPAEDQAPVSKSPPAASESPPSSPARPAEPARLAGVDGMWALRAWQSRTGRRYELRIADDVGSAGLAAVLTMLPDGLGFDRAGMVSDGTLGSGRPELVLEFTRPLVP
jgi:hypothetical protein